jgi:thiamine-phosphate pyrophosphorylase
MLRERDLKDEELLALARPMRDATRRFGAALIVNRALDVARVVGADGAHLGKDGPTIERAREALGAGATIGYSAHDPAEAQAAFEAGADYVVFGPVFPTPGKPGHAGVGLAALAEVARRAPGPVLAVGGIGLDNIASIAATGAAGAAAIRAIFAAEDPREAAAESIARFRSNAVHESE